jgi:hypothetical protein
MLEVGLCSGGGGKGSDVRNSEYTESGDICLFTEYFRSRRNFRINHEGDLLSVTCRNTGRSCRRDPVAGAAYNNSRIGDLLISANSVIHVREGTEADIIETTPISLSQTDPPV